MWRWEDRGSMMTLDIFLRASQKIVYSSPSAVNVLGMVRGGKY
jgi:hypothetical protein